LQPLANTDVQTLPEYIDFTLNCQAHQLNVRIALESHYFLGDVIKVFDTPEFPYANLLLVGPKSSGKTTLMGWIVSCIHPRTRAVESSALNISYNDEKYLERVKLHISDTSGMNEFNFDKFMNQILDSRTPSGTPSASELTHKQDKKTDSEKPSEITTLVFVVHSSFYDFHATEPIVKKLRGNIEVVQAQQYYPLMAVTHMDEVQEEKWDLVLTSLANKIGLPRVAAFPVSLINGTLRRTFESDIQALHILQKALENAQTQFQAFQDTHTTYKEL
jgi:hypothetical protein